jgi:3-hydroxyacyl-CoA dehydrogenase
MVINQNRRITEAKKSVIEIFVSGYTMPAQRKDIRVLGRSALGALLCWHQWNGGELIMPTDHDVIVAKKLAYVIVWRRSQ